MLYEFSAIKGVMLALNWQVQCVTNFFNFCAESLTEKGEFNAA